MMEIGLVTVLLKAYDKSMDFANGIIKTVDEHKFAEAVNEMYGKEPSVDEWDAAVDIIKNATDIDTEKKIQLLKMVSDERALRKTQDTGHKIDIIDKVDDHQERRAKIAVSLVTGVLTGGISLIPVAAKVIKAELEKKDASGMNKISGESVDDSAGFIEGDFEELSPEDFEEEI